MSAREKVENGVRHAQVLKAIAGFEATEADWSFKEIAQAIGVSPQQARTLVATLTMKGLLEPTIRVVKKRGVVLSDAAKQQLAAPDDQQAA